MVLRKFCVRLQCRSTLITVLLLFSPAIITLLAYNTMSAKKFEMYLAIHLALCFLALSFLPALIVKFFVGDKLKEINEYCIILKKGQFRAAVPGLDELDNNPDELQLLLQNMSWLAHSIAVRDERLTNALSNTRHENRKFGEIIFTDHLSGVYNKRFFDSNFETICAQKLKTDIPVHLVLIDCDHFKEVNDTLGHAVGDIVIAKLGELLKNAVRLNDDYPFRFGGDEFGCIFCGASAERCIGFSENLRVRFAEFDFGAADLGLSIGIAALDKKENDPAKAAERLFEEADKALYKSKKNGRNQVSFFDGKHIEIEAVP